MTKILITAGPTREQIDPVRYITNYSSGKMGYALAEAAVNLGWETTLISGPVALTPPENVNLINIETTDELAEKTLQEIKSHDCLIMAAAPSDFTPQKFISKKIKKDKSDLNLALKPTIDILKEVSKVRTKKQLIVGFALETDNHIKNAQKKLKEKKLDVIVLNRTGKDTGFNSDTNQVTVFVPGKDPIEFSLSTKSEISVKLLELIASLM